jgi:hypothetical protein
MYAWKQYSFNCFHTWLILLLQWRVTILKLLLDGKVLEQKAITQLLQEYS